MSIYTSVEYGLVKTLYGRSVAKRSLKPMIDHIDEGLTILELIEAKPRTRKAWCLHPLVQSDAALHDYYNGWNADVASDVLLLALEYRYRANSWLSDKVFINTITNSCDSIGKPEWSLLATKKMLIADKVQNYKDFLTYHYATHPRSRELNYYFLTWLEKLEVSQARFKELCEAIDKRVYFNRQGGDDVSQDFE